MENTETTTTSPETNIRYAVQMIGTKNKGFIKMPKKNAEADAAGNVGMLIGPLNEASLYLTTAGTEAICKVFNTMTNMPEDLKAQIKKDFGSIVCITEKVIKHGKGNIELASIAELAKTE